MKVYGVSAYDVDTVVTAVSRDRYDGNLVLKSLQDQSNSAGGRATFTLQVVDSHAGKPGAIGAPGHSGNGPHGMKRRSNAACWHAHWDVIEALLDRFPDARVTSGFRLRDVAVNYTKDTFKATALRTAHLNVGWTDRPVTMPQCCECDHTRYSEVEPLADPRLSEPVYRAGRAPTVPSWMPGSRALAGQRTAQPTRAGAGVDYSHNHREYCAPSPGGGYPWDAIPATQPWTPRVKPGAATVADTLTLIDQMTSDTTSDTAGDMGSDTAGERKPGA